MIQPSGALIAHRAELIHHYSALISWISTSLPMRGAGGEMSRDKQPNSEWRGTEGGTQKGGMGETGENRKINIQEG